MRWSAIQDFGDGFYFLRAVRGLHEKYSGVAEVIRVRCPSGVVVEIANGREAEVLGYVNEHFASKLPPDEQAAMDRRFDEMMARRK